MTLNEYQQRAMTTCLPESRNFSYMMLNLMSEVGEIAGKVGKAIRKGCALIDNNALITEHGLRQMGDKALEALRSECGDVLWQLAGLCDVMGWDLEAVAQENLQKLADRQARHVIDGSGDVR